MCLASVVHNRFAAKWKWPNQFNPFHLISFMHRSACWSISVDFIANAYHPSNGVLHILRHQRRTAIHEITQTIRNRWYHSSVQSISNRYKSVHRHFCEYLNLICVLNGIARIFELRWVSNPTTKSLKMAMTLYFKWLNYEFSNWKWETKWNNYTIQ